MKEEAIKTSVFTIKNEKGEKMECEVLFTFESPETKKNYIVYTDNTSDESGALKVYANIYNQNETSKELFPIETEEEWNTIEAILAKLEKTSEGANEKSNN